MATKKMTKGRIITGCILMLMFGLPFCLFVTFLFWPLGVPMTIGLLGALPLVAITQMRKLKQQNV